MAYPPPNPGYPPPNPGYPPPAGYPQETSPWGSAAPYQTQPPMPTPGGAPVLGFGSTAASSYPSSQSSAYPIGLPPSQPSYSGNYPSQPPLGDYPPQSSHGGFPQPTPGNFPQPLPMGGFPQQPPPGGYPQQPPLGGYPQQPPLGGYPQQPPPGSYPQQPPLGNYRQQPPPGGYPQQSPPGSYPQPTPVGYPQQPSPGDYPQHPPSREHIPPVGQPQQPPTVANISKQDSPSHHTPQSSSTSSPSKPTKVVTHGTVKTHTPFNAEDDAKTLRKAMKGFGTDEKAIINVVAYRSNSQRQQIKLKFKTVYGKDLISDLKSELGGHFEEVVLGLMMTPVEYDASAVYKAIKGLGTDESTLIEILCTRTNEEILALKRQYKTDHGRDVEKDVASDTSGHFKRLLVSLLTGARDRDGDVVDHDRARTDAQAMYQAGEAKWGTDESKFNEVLAARSFDHLRVVFYEYSKICKYDIEQSIEREMSGDLKTSFLTVVKCVKDKSAYFAERLYKSMKGLGTDDDTLVRVMVTRCEVDMEDIKEKFYQKYHKHLGSFIKGDTSGDYRRILMALARADEDD